MSDNENKPLCDRLSERLRLIVNGGVDVDQIGDEAYSMLSHFNGQMTESVYDLEEHVMGLTAERDEAVAECNAVRNAIGNDMLKNYIEKHGDPIPLVLELEAYKAALEKIESLSMSMFKDPYDMIGECVNIACNSLVAMKEQEQGK